MAISVDDYDSLDGDFGLDGQERLLLVRLCEGRFGLCLGEEGQVLYASTTQCSRLPKFAIAQSPRLILGE